MEQAKIVSRRLVKPAVPTPDHNKICKMSIFDQLAPPAHVPLVFFYNNFPVEGKLDILVNSLSETLTRFYPLAGRFVREGFYLDCNDEGVLYVEAEHDIELSDFLKIAVNNIDMVSDLVPWADVGETTLITTPPLAMKVTVFKCGGVAIGTLESHIVADGYTADKVVYDWATTSSKMAGSINHAVAPVLKPADFGIAHHFPARDLSSTIKNMVIPSSKMKESRIVTKRFVFDENSMATLKAKVSKSNANVTRPTRVEVVTSTIWKALINTSLTQTKPRDSTLFLHLNLRGRTAITGEPGLECGNFYLEVPSRFKQNGKFLGAELHDLVGTLRTGLRKSLGEFSKISSTDELFLEVAKYVNGIRDDKASEEVDVWLLSSLCRFPFYEVDFGFGKPEWVTTGGIPAEIIFLLDTKCGTGIEAMVNLHESDMVQFEKDPDIMEFTS